MDVVTMNIIDSAMVSICREMGITLMKTSYSTIFNEGLDFTCALSNPAGEMIAVAEFCPAQIGGMPLIIQSSVRELSSEPMEPGDVIVHNDPYRGGLHTPEHTFFKPVFLDGELMGYAAACGHVAEIGGMVPGGFAPEATEIFHEGLRIPPVKIRRRGEDVPEVWKLLLANVRTPRQNYGDYRALIAAADLGEQRMVELIKKYGKDVFERTTEDLMNYAEARMRAELTMFPDGVYSFDDYIENDGIEDREFKIHVEVFVQNDEVIVDFTGTSPQARGPINATLGVVWSATYNALLHLTDPSIPKNSGCFRPIRVIAPPGTIVNVDYPAPEVGGNTETHPRIAYAVIGALAACVPERSFAADGGTHSNFLFGGVDPRTGEYFVCYDFMNAGWGGRSFADGNSAVNCINGNSRATPTEVFETRFPWQVECHELVPDSGGSGKFRGGLGITKTLRCRDAHITVSYLADRHKRAPWGLAGGGEGGKASILFQPAGRDTWTTFDQEFNKVSGSKFANVTIRPDDRVRITSPGGGGWGPPGERPHEDIREDIREGFVTQARARQDYGHEPPETTETEG